MQQDQRRFSFARRLLFPYSGEVPLTRKQGRRVIIVWMIFLSILLTLCAMPVAVVFGSNASWQRLGIAFLAIFLIGVFTFGMSAWFVVLMVNRSARSTQRWRERHGQQVVEHDNASGG
jgi:hypothetical protein